VKPAMRGIAFASCAGVVLAACSLSSPQRIAGAPQTRPVPRQSVLPSVCPTGHLLPDGGRVEIEWVDFLQFGGRQYIAGFGPSTTNHLPPLGPAISHVRCSLAASVDHRHIDIPLVNGSAAFLPAGAAIFEVRGYSPGCRLAGYVDGRLHVYLAQRQLRGRSAPRRCAI
jgi:hypothetical protein